MEHKQEQRLSKLKLSETLFALSQARVEACANALKNCQIMVVFKKGGKNYYLEKLNLKIQRKNHYLEFLKSTI